MQYVLIAIFYLGSGQGIAVTTHEFSSLSTCTQAAETMKKMYDNGRNRLVRTECVNK
jgi:hypothetical protein